MQNKEVNQKLVEDLKYYYEDKKRLTNKYARYIDTKKNEDYMQEAGRLCEEMNMSAAAYIQFFYDRMGQNKEYFSPQHLRGENARKILKAEQESENGYKVEINNSNIPYDLLWQQQQDMAMRYLKLGYTTKDMLLDPSLKFAGWFRILATPEIFPEVIVKYRNIAKKELTPRLIEFIKEQNLELSRITSEYE